MSVMTRLEKFLKAYGIKPRLLADVTGISRQHLLRLRLGRADPTRIMMVWLAGGCSRLLHRRVRATELFDLGEVPYVEMVDAITIRHGRRFAKTFIDMALTAELSSEAFGRASIMKWPDRESDGGVDAQTRFNSIEDEILEKTFAPVRDALAASFVKAANEVLNREREADREAYMPTHGNPR